eukprot:gene12182-biopygen2185
MVRAPVDIGRPRKTSEDIQDIGMHQLHIGMHWRTSDDMEFSLQDIGGHPGAWSGHGHLETSSEHWRTSEDVGGHGVAIEGHWRTPGGESGDIERSDNIEVFSRSLGGLRGKIDCPLHIIPQSPAPNQVSPQ